MSQSMVNLFNQALTTVGAAPEITDPEANSKAANICRLWFDPARQAVMSAHHWPSVRKAARLARKATRSSNTDWQSSDPRPGFAYAFALPSDCLQPQYLADFSRFTLGRLGDTQALHGNTEHPILYYTCDCRNPAMWSADLYLCVVFSLAAHINMAKSGKLQTTQKLEQRVFELIELASVNEANADDEWYESVPAQWQGAGFDIPPQNRFFYPTSTFRVGGIG